MVDSRFQDISGPGIQICCDADEWWEGVGAERVTINNCAFVHCNFGVASRAAALDIFSTLAHGKAAAAGTHQWLQILANTFENNSGAALHIGSSENVLVRHNRFYSRSEPAILVDHSGEIDIENNHVIDGTATMVLGSSADRSTIRIHDNFALGLKE